MFGPQSATFRQETEMADNSLRALHATHNAEDPVQRLRLLCLSRGASGFLDLGRLFRRMDEDGNRKLNLEGFISGLRGIGLEITDHEAKDMFEIFDTDGTGSLNMEEFLEQLRVSVQTVTKLAYINLPTRSMTKITICSWSVFHSSHIQDGSNKEKGTPFHAH